uniref:Uncharacterized protein n=1 Tax=Astyanax mexicanus TaxID=7994 RepID=A0A8B9GRZ1_ASTMX
MDVSAVIEQMETGEQDAALAALQRYNQEECNKPLYKNNWCVCMFMVVMIVHSYK